MSERDELGHTMPSMSRPSADKPAEREALPAVTEERYTLPEGVVDPELGRGGMGRVLRLHDPHLGREVAVKELLPVHRLDGLMETLFVREARVLARLEHPGVVPVYELGRRPDGTPFYAMRRVRGRSFLEVERTCASLSDRLALLGHFLTVAQTMGYAHSRGVVHRDLKPDNVMVSGFGETLVIDWGLAIVDGVVGEGITAGTPAYMAPEQCAGTGVDAQSDVWSLGVMLYELLAGKLPFSGTSSTDVMNAVQHGALPRLLDHEPHAPLPLVRVVERALQRSPANRYANAGDLADALEAAMREREPRNRGPLYVAAGLGAALLLSLGWAFAQRDEVDDAHRDARLQVGDAQRARSVAVTTAALEALRAHDTLEAARLAALEPDNAQAVGLGLLAAEQGLPTKAWSVATEAGCGPLATVDGLVACPTLNEVLLFGPDGKPRGRLATGTLGWVHGVAPLPEHQVAVGGDDRVLRVFDLGTQHQVSQTPAFPAGITALAADGATITVGLQNGDVVTSAGELVHHHQRPVLTMVASHGVLASSAGESMYVKRSDGEAALDRRAGAVAFLGDELVVGVERTVAVLGADGAGRTWGNHLDDVTALTVLRDGRVVSGGADRALAWWSSTGALEGRAAGAAQPIRSLATLNELVVVAMGRELSAYSLPPVRQPAWEERPSAMTVSGARKQVFAGFIDGRVQRFDLPNGPASTLEVRHTAAVRAVVEVPGAEAPERLRVLTAGDDGQVRAQRWNGEVESLDDAHARVLALAVSADGQRAAWSAEDGTLVLYSLEFGKEIWRGKDALTRALAFSPDGRVLALGRDDKRLALRSAETGAVELEADPFDAPVTVLSWASADEVAVGRADGTLSAYSRSGKRVTTQWSGLPRVRVTALTVRDGHVLAGTEDGQAFTWEVEGGAPLLQLTSDSGAVGAIDLVGGVLIYGGTDRVVHALTLAGHHETR